MISHLSVSQLQLHRDHPRKWILEYVERIKSPPTPHLEFGNWVHDCLERGIRGEPLKMDQDLSRLPSYEVIFDWLSTNAGVIESYEWNLESDFKIYLCPSLPPIVGRIDMWSYDGRQLKVFDHKTVNPKFKETEETLKRNWQLALYVHALEPGLWYQIQKGLQFVGNLLPLPLIGHNQFLKNYNMQLTGYQTVKTKLEPDIYSDVLSSICIEARSLLKNIKLYQEGGMTAVPLKKGTEKWYGKKDPMWECICGRESVEDLRKRLEGLNIS